MSCSDPTADEPFLDGEDVLRELRLQLDAVKARIEAHRETMEAAGLAAPRPQGEEEQERCV